MCKTILTLVFKINVGAVNEEVLLGCCIFVNFSSALLGHACLHARGKSIVRVQVALHSVLSTFFILDETGSDIALVGKLLALSHAGFQVLFQLLTSGVVLSVGMIIIEQSVRVEQYLIND